MFLFPRRVSNYNRFTGDVSEGIVCWFCGTRRTIEQELADINLTESLKSRKQNAGSALYTKPGGETSARKQ